MIFTFCSEYKDHRYKCSIDGMEYLQLMRSGRKQRLSLHVSGYAVQCLVNYMNQSIFLVVIKLGHLRMIDCHY